jgi:hypothetical protein
MHRLNTRRVEGGTTVVASKCSATIGRNLVFPLFTNIFYFIYSYAYPDGNMNFIQDFYTSINSLHSSKSKKQTVDYQQNISMVLILML